MIKKYICERCGKEFKTEEECLKHESNHHPSKIEKYKVKYDDDLSNLYSDHLSAVRSSQVPTSIFVRWNGCNTVFVYKVTGCSLYDFEGK